MIVENKRYQASYYQAPVPELMDTLAVQNLLKKKLLQKYTEGQIENPTEEQRKEMSEFIQKEMIDITMDILSNKSVWFLISEHYGKYFIAMYYDNIYNQANGEDL